MFLNIRKEIAGGALQRARECKQHRQRRLVLTKFQHTDVVPPYIGLERKLLLCQFGAKAMFTQDSTEDFGQLQTFSPSEMGELSLWRYNLSSQ